MTKIKHTIITLIMLVSLGGGLVVGGTAHDFTGNINVTLHR